MSADDIDFSDAVTLAYLHRDQVEASWHQCMTDLFAHDLMSYQRVMRGGYVSMTAETDGLARARNKAVKEFLQNREAMWMCWIDTDMGFEPDSIDRLMAKADPDKYPIIGGLAFTWRQERPDGMGGWRHLATPTIFDWGQDGREEGWIVRWNYELNKLQRCGATGSAFILIHRSVFEKIEAKFGQKWYDRFHNPKMDRLISEDLSFCMRAELVGCHTHVDTGVKTSHSKTIYVSENDFFAQRALAQMVPDVPAATEKTAVIVPVLGRPQNAKPFMESLRKSGADLATAYAVVDDSEDGEVVQAWHEAGAKIINFPDEDYYGKGTFAEKVNYAYAQTDEPWLFLVGDDVKFHPGWLDHLQYASRDGAHVIGSNDLKNPRVVKGDHATHLLVRRAYVDERGASWDGPKVVAHEGYGHWYVDDEIVTAARARGVWAFAQHSKVEHFHPLWGDGKMDATYELGKSKAPADKELFEQRAAENL